MNGFQRAARLFNRGAVPLMGLPLVGPLLGRSMTILTYRGRKSGASRELPVAYRRRGDSVLVGVAMPEKKTWWRNFTGDGGPVSLTLDGRTRTGHAVTSRADDGAVQVRITLDA